ncbi:hypothetical protein SAMN05443292_0831 [Halpernia frigidisoli]|uniref:Uncharacterized protein n=1 Tax=Halpernia frigidisoli TaxID=1125876 RepID=A0A1I3E1Z2_9FLAO|nr:hypothetical protein SAMN05443292_0831 [Halpernia frigidisoli]
MKYFLRIFIAIIIYFLSLKIGSIVFIDLKKFGLHSLETIKYSYEIDYKLVLIVFSLIFLVSLILSLIKFKNLIYIDKFSLIFLILNIVFFFWIFVIQTIDMIQFNNENCGCE